MAEQHLIERARHADLLALAGQHTQLHRESAREMSGPCPRCGGRDRFHCTASWFFCRQCHPRRGDAIEFVRWLGLAPDFRSAIQMLLDGKPMAAVRPARQPARPQQRQQQRADDGRDDGWAERADGIVRQAQNTLWDDTQGQPARDYLLGRGLDPQTWLAWGWGYRPDVAVPGTNGSVRAPAIVLPWYVAGRLVAVRYRFLEVQAGHKMASLHGSRFAGHMYGGHLLPEFVRLPPDPGRRPVEALSTLLICEGELNAASIWQVAAGTRLDVLSLGSESQRLPDGVIELAGRYGQVLVWMDRHELAQKLAAPFPNARALGSPNGQDANDLLRAGDLGYILGLARMRACEGDRYRLEGLLWELWDAADSIQGVDAGTARIIRALAGQLGHQVELYEFEPGRFHTSRIFWIVASIVGEGP
jgi:hypothetical protein